MKIVVTGTRGIPNMAPYVRLLGLEICVYPEYFNELGIEKGKYILGMCRFAPEKNRHHLSCFPITQEVMTYP